jgi:hypothetical protein
MLCSRFPDSIVDRNSERSKSYRAQMAERTNKAKRVLT